MSPTPHISSRQALLTAGSLLWLLVVGGGLRSLWAYSLAPGLAADAPSRWPAESRLARPAGRPVLVVLAHPQCPCSRATIAELARLMAHAGGRVDARVLVLHPAGTSADWVRTDLWNSAAAIPGVSVSSDDEGLEARRFGAATSGQTLLYDGEGRLVFRGGITDARGHEGDNAGSRALARFLVDGVNAGAATPVFGCPLFDPKCPQGGDSCRNA